MKKVIIIGCGFGGLDAVKFLSRFKKDIALNVIDSNEYFNFLPCLPDVISKKINPDFLIYPIEDLSRRYGFDFINEEIIRIDIEKNEVFTRSKTFPYDYLIIASGSETNFYDNLKAKKFLYKLDNVADARAILNALENNKFDYYVIFGGGYTGIEIATHLKRYLNKNSINKKVIIVEKTSDILGQVPKWMRGFVYDNLRELNIDVCFNNAAINGIEERKVRLSCLDIVDNALLIWTAGVKTADFVRDLAVAKNSQGRLITDEYLRISKNCFVIGDAAGFLYKEQPLRMAVQFALTQGRFAGRNVFNLVYRLPLVGYKPFDFGYIIPMANNNSCGKILGLNMSGLLPTCLHYIMSIYRSYGLKNKLGMIRDLLNI